MPVVTLTRVKCYLSNLYDRWLARLDPTTPLTGHSTSITDARRFALLIAIAFFASAYAVFQEHHRRALLPTVVFFDYLLAAMDYVDAGSVASRHLLTEDPPDLYGSALNGKVVLDKARTMIRPVLTVVPVGLCPEDLYEVEPRRDAVRPGRSYGPTEPKLIVKPVGVHVLIEFHPVCAGKNLYGAKDDYAMIGRFVVGEQPENTTGALFDDGGTLFFAQKWEIELHLRMLASRITGYLYGNETYRKALTDFLTYNERGPEFLGVSIPRGYAVLALPFVLFFLAVSFLHRVRRLPGNDSSPWLLVRPSGVAEKAAAILWVFILAGSSPMAYWAVAQHRAPGDPQLRSASDFFSEPEILLDSFYSIAFTMLQQMGYEGQSRDPWILYAKVTCGLSLVLMLLSFVVLIRHACRRQVTGAARCVDAQVRDDVAVDGRPG